jgi:hypothetical protein
MVHARVHKNTTTIIIMNATTTTVKRAPSPFKKAAGTNQAPVAAADAPESVDDVYADAAPEEGGTNSLAPQRDFYVSVSDMRLPAMKVVAKVGPLSDKFPAGSIVLDGQHVVSDGKTPITFTVLAGRRKWIEDKPYKANPEPGERANIFYSKEEVQRNGGTTEWSNDPDTGQGIRPTYNEALDLTILLKNPEGDATSSAYFPFTDDETGDTYAIVTYSLTNTAFRKCAEKFFTAYGLHLKGDWFKGQFELTTGTVPVSGNAVICPEVRYGKMNSDEYIAWIKELIPSE